MFNIIHVRTAMAGDRCTHPCDINFAYLITNSVLDIL